MRIVDAHPVLVVLVASLASRVVFAVVSFVVNHLVLIPDERVYIELAEAVVDGDGADAWAPGYGGALLRSTCVFSVPLVALFEVFGSVRLVGQLWSVCWGVATALLTYRLAREALSTRWAVAAGLVVALLPSQILWSSLVLRESMVWAALAAIALVLTRSSAAHGRRVALAVLACAALLLALVYLRSQTAIVAAWAVAISGWLVPGRDRIARALCLTLVAVVVPAIGGYGPGGVDLVDASTSTIGRTRTYLGFDADTAFTPTSVFTGELPDDACVDGRSSVELPTNTLPGADAIARHPSMRLRDASGNLVEVVCAPDGTAIVVQNDLGSSVSGIPRGIAATLLRPFPGEWLDAPEARVAGVENVMWYALYALAVVGVVRLRRRLDVLAFPVVLAAGIIGASVLTQGNIGTAFRHRAQVLWVLVVLAAAGGQHLLEWRRSRTSVEHR